MRPPTLTPCPTPTAPQPPTHTDHTQTWCGISLPAAPICPRIAGSNTTRPLLLLLSTVAVLLLLLLLAAAAADGAASFTPTLQ